MKIITVSIACYAGRDIRFAHLQQQLELWLLPRSLEFVVPFTNCLAGAVASTGQGSGRYRRLGSIDCEADGCRCWLRKEALVAAFNMIQQQN